MPNSHPSPPDQPHHQSQASSSSSAPASPSLLHLLANASQQLPSQIPTSYHLSPLAPTPPRPESPPPPPSQQAQTSTPGGTESSAGPTPPAAAPLGNTSKKRKVEEDKHPAVKGPSGGGKAVLSCAECRRLKLKCDRVFPCTNCKKRGVAMICPDEILKGGKGKRLILASTTDLHARISQLEQALSTAHRQLSDKPHPLLEGSFHFEPLDADQRPGGNSKGKAKEKIKAEGDGGLGTGDEAEDPVMKEAPDNPHGSLTMGQEPGASRFYGNAGSAYLLGKPMSATRSNPPPHGFAMQSSFVPSRNGLTGGSLPLGLPAALPFEMSTMGIPALKNYLPPPDEARRLRDIYFRNASWQYCILLESTFDDEFLAPFYSDPSYLSVHPLNSGNTPHEINSHKLAVLFVTFAVASLFDLQSAPYSSTAKHYYELSKIALASNTSSSITFVQAIHLMGTYLLNDGTTISDGGEKFWTLLGFAMKSAQSIGLHRDGQAWNLSKEEVEDRRRVFWELNSYDILQSVTQGRPRAMNAAAIDTKFPGSSSVEDMAKEPLYHQHKLRLMSIISRLNDQQSQTKPCAYREVLQIDRDIRAFERSLPPELHCTEESCVLPTDKSPIIVLQRHTLLVWINQALLFLHRAWFARALRDRPKEPLHSRFASSYIAELQASKTVISVSRDILRLQPVLVSRHWFFFFHALSSTVNLAVAVLQAPGSALTGSAFKELESGIALFEMAQPGCRVRDDLPFLKRLRDRAFAKLTAHANSQSPSSNPAYLSQQQQASNTSSHSPHTTAKDEHEHEDLNLIGAETLLRRVDTSHARTSPVSRPAPLSNLPDGGTSTPSEPVDELSRSSSVGNSSHNGGPSHHQSPHSTQQQQAQGHVQQHLQPFNPVAQGDATIFATQLPTTLDEAIAVKDAHVSAAGFEADIRAHPSWMADPTFWGGTAVPAGGEEGALFGFASGPANNLMNGPEEFDFDGFLAGIGVANQDDIAGEF